MGFSELGTGGWVSGQHRQGGGLSERRSFHGTDEEDISDCEAYHGNYFKDLPPIIEGTNHFIPFKPPKPVDVPPYQDFLLRGLRYAMYRPVCREILRQKHPPHVFRQIFGQFIRPWDGPPSLSMSMCQIAKKCDRHHKELIANRQGRRMRGPIVKRQPPPEPEKEDLSSDENDVILRAIGRPRTRLATGRLIRNAVRDSYPTPPATSEDEIDDDVESPKSDEKGEEEGEEEGADDDNDSDDGLGTKLKRKRRKGHIEGINRKTGEKTLVGLYPPLIDAEGKYHCPLAECFAETGKGSWSTKNGYKYHLMTVCLQVASRRIGQGD